MQTPGAPGCLFYLLERMLERLFETLKRLVEAPERLFQAPQGYAPAIYVKIPQI